MTAQTTTRFTALIHDLVPGGAHTYSKGDDQFPATAPSLLMRGKGAYVWDAEDCSYVDWGMGINNVLLGHAEDSIDQAAIAALRGGQNLSRPSLLELELAEELSQLIPGHKMVKFAKNGSDANTAAVRLARAITGRDLVAVDGEAPFLSIHDWFIGSTVMDAGVPPTVKNLTVKFRYGDFDSVDELFIRHGSRLAAVVMEPCRQVRPPDGFLQHIRRLCDEWHVILIFDEIVTNFRYWLNGSESGFHVRPDLTTVGKGIANGYALSALLGKPEYMERGGLRHSEARCFLLSTTNGAERSALAAGRATLDFYKRNQVIERLYEVGRSLMEGMARVASEAGIQGFLALESDFPCRPIIVCRDGEGRESLEFKTLFCQEMARHGILMPWVCPSFRHGEEEISRTLEAGRRAAKVYSEALDEGSAQPYLEGPPVKPVFRRFN